MQSPEGRDYWSTGVFREIVPPERIVCSDSFSDEKGNVVPSSHYGIGGDWSLELVVMVTFEKQNGKTTFTLGHAGFPSGEMRDLAKAGGDTSLNKLGGLLR